jgi:ureidoacrylate peracid hydrolase
VSSWADYALLLVDVQRDFYPKDVSREHPRLPERVAGLLVTCRTRGVEVVHVQARFAADGSDWMRRYLLRGRIPCVDGTPGAEVLDCARPDKGERVLVKHTFDGFLETHLHAHLRASGRRFVLVAGLVTSTCVLFTASTATQLGYLVAVFEDCCGDRAGIHEQVLDSYPFVFSRTASDRLDVDRPSWDAALDRLRELDASGAAAFSRRSSSLT